MTDGGKPVSQLLVFLLICQSGALALWRGIMEIILTDNNGMEVDLIALYQNKLIPNWEQEQIDEILKLARKDYPGVSSLKDLINETTGLQVRKTPFLIDSFLICAWQFLFEDTKKKFRPKTVQDFASPQVLAYDAALKLQKHQDWNLIKFLHRSLVEAALLIRLYIEAWNAKVSKEQYGRKIIELIFSKKTKDQENALKDLERMLNAKCRKELVLKSIIDSPLSEEKSTGIIHETIAKKINKSRKEAPGLAAFLPNGLDSVVHKTIEKLLAPHKSEDAKLFSDAVAGVFRTLPNESAKDFADELRKLSTKKRDALEEISIDQEELDKKDSDDESQFKKNDRLKLAYNKFNELVEELICIDALTKLKEELNKPKNKKLEEFYNELLKNPGASDANLANLLGLHRNTVSSYQRKIQELLLAYM